MTSPGLFAVNLRRLAEIPSRIAREVSGELAEMIEEEFEEGADPYGNAWSTLKGSTLQQRSQTSEPPLTDTRTMRESLRVRPARGAGVAISIDQPAGIHQTGWAGGGNGSSGPARPVLPGGTFPSRWRETIDAVAERRIREAVEEGGRG